MNAKTAFHRNEPNRSDLANRGRHGPLGWLTFLAGVMGLAGAAGAQTLTGFTAGDLVISSSVYAGTASTITVGQALPGGGTAVVNGSYPNVWANETPDPSFGIAAPIFLNEITTTGTLVGTMNVTSLVSSELGENLNTSFSSKSELAINLSADGTALTFMGYLAPTNALDVSNSNTPNNIDPTNPIAGSTQRAVAQINADGSIELTPSDAYTGDNSRAVILADGNYYMAGSAGNSGSGVTAATTTMIANDSGIQMIAAGSTTGLTTVVGQVNGSTSSTTGYQRGFSIASVGFAADKSGKDDNLRGLTLDPFNDTLYTTKGSGGSGINSVYQVGTGGLPTLASAGATPLTILPGFSQVSAKTGLNANGTAGTIMYPFGLFFANATTLYVSDEGAPLTPTNSAGIAAAANDPFAGLQKWTFDGTKWNLQYTLQAGLNLGVQYSVANDANGNVYPTNLDPATAGLRNITGQVNANGTVTIYGVSSTASLEGDQGADPNELFAITDSLSATTLPTDEDFSVIDAAVDGEVLRGISFAPSDATVPEPATTALIFGACAGLVIAFRRKRSVSALND
jgi:hypothetical protein